MAPKNLKKYAGKRGAVLTLRVTPRASKNEIVEVLSNGMVKVHLTAPPVDGKANDALLKFLAEVLDVPVSHLVIMAGAAGRNKYISVLGMDAEILHKRIVEHIN